jgi:Putative adhesin
MLLLLSAAPLLAALLAAGGEAPALEGPPRGRERLVVASGSGTLSSKVPGPIQLSLRVAAAAVEAVPSAASEVRATLEGAPGSRLTLVSQPGQATALELEFDGHRRLAAGRLRLEVPPGSRLSIFSLDGRISVKGVRGEVTVRASSGDIDLSGATKVDAEAVDGEVDVLEAEGPVRVRTVSGAVTVSTLSAAPRLELETSSGDIEWRGACGKGCHVDADSVSGRLRFALAKESSFVLSTITHSGRLDDALGLTSLPDARPRELPEGRTWHRAGLGAREGEIECETFSGDVVLTARRLP